MNYTCTCRRGIGKRGGIHYCPLHEAAPELYEALVGLNAYCEAYFQKDHGSHFWDFHEDITKAIAEVES